MSDDFNDACVLSVASVVWWLRVNRDGRSPTERPPLPQDELCIYSALKVRKVVAMSVGAAIREDAPAILVSRFMDELQEPRKPYISSERFAERLGMSKMTLARLAGVHRNTLRTNPASEVLQARLREMIKIIIAASQLTGDIEKAKYWFMNEPILDYRGKTAAELVSDGKFEAVLAFLEDLRNGASG